MPQAEDGRSFEEGLAEFHRLAILDEHCGYRALGFGFDLVHDFHGLK